MAHTIESTGDTTATFLGLMNGRAHKQLKACRRCCCVLLFLVVVIAAIVVFVLVVGASGTIICLPSRETTRHSFGEK